MTFANIELTSTFDQWRTLTNQLSVLGNKITENNVLKIATNSQSILIPPSVNVGDTLRLNVSLSGNIEDLSTTNIPSAAAVNTVYYYASMAHAKANTVNIATQAASAQANGSMSNVTYINVAMQASYTKANSANYYAYLVDINARSAFIQANLVFDKANAANLLAFTANNVANAANVLANSANIVAHYANNLARSANTIAMSAYGQANVVAANVNYTNTAMQAAFGRANVIAANVNYTNTAMQAAFARANNSLINLAGQTGATFIGNLVATGVFKDTRAGSTYDVRQSFVATPSAATSSFPSYTLSGDDAGKLLVISCATIMLPGGNTSNPLQAGDVVKLYNANNITVAGWGKANANIHVWAAANMWTSGNTLHQANQVRTIYANSIIVITCISANTYVAEGIPLNQ